MHLLLACNHEIVNIARYKHSLLLDASHSVNRHPPSCCALEVAVVDLKSSMKGGSVYICNVNKLCITPQRRCIRVHYKHVTINHQVFQMFTITNIFQNKKMFFNQRFVSKDYITNCKENSVPTIMTMYELKAYFKKAQEVIKYL